MRSLLALTFSFYFPLFLPSLFLFLFLFLTNKKFMANLYNSAKEGVDTNDVFSFPTPSAHQTAKAKVHRSDGHPNPAARIKSQKKAGE